MSVLVARLLLLVACAALGLAGGPALGWAPVVGLAAGLAAAAIAIALEVAVRRVALRPLAWTCGGVLAGLVAGLAVGVALGPLAGEAASVLRATTALLGGWLGGVVAARRAAEAAPDAEAAAGGPPRILDTSAVIDGRIADVADAGFLDGPVIVPRFVVGELQRLADGSDPLRRARGRRGFDVLDRLRRSPGVRLELLDADVPGVAEVDGKLVALARERGARLLTNDTALGRVAALAGVAVGNVNDLAAALRPVALPGDGMAVQLVREGKEAGQGVGYLEDGTMVVVEGGKRFLGQPLEVVVTSVLQTSAGRMVFARPRGDEVVRDA
jgi:uncharacterized protein YacL